MSTEMIENSTLWQNTLAECENDTFQRVREELRSAFYSFRSNVIPLVAQIAAHFPNLTQHDISHLDALWDVASLIAGSNYPLNPLEAFVFGGAVLLHDSALCFEAYEGGEAAVRETTTWKDIFAYETQKAPNCSLDEQYKAADFLAIRALHADQAANLTQMSWISPTNGQSLYLIEHARLRSHLGSLIGKIASSHHWDIEDILQKLPNQINAPSGFPREWRVDPIKIACLLRCADAAHIDNLRAPDFLHALLKRQGISFQHWQAQNKLAQADIDQQDPTQSTLLYTSTSPFLEADSSAWWIAFDTTCLIDREIRSSNALLEARNLPQSPSFAIKRVKGIESPERMSNFIRTQDWHPCTAEIHVSNLEKLVGTLGGEQLYGSSSDKLEVVIRELIQNSRDAIKARETLEPSHQGLISIRLSQVDDCFWLTIEDNGIGMSKKVMTGALLDFGTSFWSSSLVKSEFPSLCSSTFKSVGKFGIGFYSIFMVANQVKVTSRPYTKGLNEANQITFQNGISFRPILKTGSFSELSSQISTHVSIRLNPELILDDYNIIIKPSIQGQANFSVPFTDYISAISAGLDTKIVYFDKNNNQQILHQPEFMDDKLEWLSTISFSKYQKNCTEIMSYITRYIHRLRPIVCNQQTLGFACISTDLRGPQNFLNISTVGGLATTVHMRHNHTFIGYIEYIPDSAKRHAVKFMASSETLHNWGTEQLRIIQAEQNISPMEKYAAANSLAAFGVDPSPIAMIPICINGGIQIIRIEEINQLFQHENFVFLKSSYMDFLEVHHNILSHENGLLIRPLTNGALCQSKLENNIPINNNSLIDIVYRKLSTSGNTPLITIIKDSAQGHFGTLDSIIFSRTPI